MIKKIVILMTVALATTLLAADMIVTPALAEQDSSTAQSFRPLHDRVLIRPNDGEGDGKNAGHQGKKNQGKKKKTPRIGKKARVMKSRNSGAKHKGEVKWFNKNKGYGFIQPAEGGKDAGKNAAGGTDIFFESAEPPEPPSNSNSPLPGSKARPSKWKGPAAKSENAADGDSKGTSSSGRFGNYRPQFYFRGQTGKNKKKLKQKSGPEKKGGWPAKVKGPAIKSDHDSGGQGDSDQKIDGFEMKNVWPKSAPAPASQSNFGTKNPNNPATK